MSCYSFRGADGDFGSSGIAIATATAILVCDEVDGTWNVDGSDYGTRVYTEWTHGLQLSPNEAFALRLRSFFYNPTLRPTSRIRIVPQVEILDDNTIRFYARNRAYGAALSKDNFGRAENHPAFHAVVQKLPASYAAPIITVEPLYNIDGIYD